MNKSLRILCASATAMLVALPSFAADAKRVIVCTVTTGFRHSSIPTAEKTLQKLADESKAFTIVDFARQPEAIQVPKKPNKPNEPKAEADEKTKAKYEGDLKKYNEQMAQWTPEKEQAAKDAQGKFDEALKQSLAKLSPQNLAAQKIDGVIFANTTGDLPLPDKEGFIKWIQDGHAFMAMHSASDTFHGFPGYIDMLQGEFQTHGAQVPADLIQGDPKHPATEGLPNPWNLKQEEMYIIKNHDRTKARDLWFLRHHPNQVDQAGFFPVSWCRKAGTGRVFYTSLGHREDVWDADPNMKGRVNSPEVAQQYQQHVLGGIKWALGLAEGSAEPNPEVK
ncbi:ThuA domain-containing protein [Verrucomicrobiota bacterium sgz303538]